MPHFLHQIAYSREGWQANTQQFLTIELKLFAQPLKNLTAKSRPRGSPSVTTTLL
jgi:hypothetical protein